MVRGLDLFRARFREFEGSFVLIGGAACDEWFTASGLVFRVTKDLDVVLIIEVLAPEPDWCRSATVSTRRFMLIQSAVLRRVFRSKRPMPHEDDRSKIAALNFI